jgi:dihydrofolate reductase
VQISIVVAAATNHVIGGNNELLWSLPNDMRFFKNITWGMPIIMGRKTYESIGKPLPGRLNIVLSTSLSSDNEALKIAPNLNEAIAIAKNVAAVKQVFIIGGANVYEQALPICNKIYLTRVHANLVGDVFFKLDEQQFKLQKKQSFFKDEKHAYNYDFEEWERVLIS